MKEMENDMAITREQAIEILAKFDFFQGQRAGRELWNDKPFEVQEEDVKTFSRDVAELKAYIADVVPKSEIEAYMGLYKCEMEKAFAREIFEEIEELLKRTCEKGYCGSISDLFAELKKKYTEGEQ